MISTAAASAAPTVNPAGPEERGRHLPLSARAALDRFEAEGDPAALDVVLRAVLEHFVPHTPARPVAEMPGSAGLISDLGFDSLAITEVVFYLEDLFGIRVTNQEITEVRTVDELRQFIRRKVGARAAS